MTTQLSRHPQLPVLDRPSPPTARWTLVAIRSCDCGIQGPERLILDLASPLREAGVRYVIVNLWDGSPPQVALHDAAQREGIESHIIRTRFGADPSLVPQLRQLLEQLRPDVVHAHDWKSDLAVLLATRGRPYALVSSYYGRLTMRSWFVKTTDVVRLLLLRCFGRVLANSRAQRDELLAWRLAPRQVSILPSFVDTTAVRPPTDDARLAARQRLNLTPQQPVLATVARLSVNKGHRYLLTALAQLRERYPDLVYLVVGEGDATWRGEGGYRAVLERQSALLGIADQVRFLGYYPDLATILAAADLIVSPSLREGMQVSLLEAMAAGRPIVATAIGGTPDAVLHNETGLLVPPADASALAAAIAALLADPERRHQLGAAGRLRAERCFDVRIVTDQLRFLCTDLVANG